jgi:predicted transcriptional regulator
MAIQPAYARRILAGLKKVEFRKRPLAEDVRTVLIYETAPTQRVIGTFTVAAVEILPPAELWSRFSDVAGIDYDDFRAYYSSTSSAVALRVANPAALERPVPLGALRPVPAVPQSFVYLDASILDQVRATQPPERDLRRLRRATAQAAFRPLQLLRRAAQPGPALRHGLPVPSRSVPSTLSSVVSPAMGLMRGQGGARVDRVQTGPVAQFGSER